MNRLFGIAVVGFLLAVGSLGHVVPSPALLWTSSQRDIQVPGSSLNTHRFEDLTSSLLSDDEGMSGLDGFLVIVLIVSLLLFLQSISLSFTPHQKFGMT